MKEKKAETTRIGGERRKKLNMKTSFEKWRKE